MLLLYESFIEPVLARVGPGVVVEIGSEFGGTTQRLIEFCLRTGATFHAVDPEPRFDAADWPERYGGSAVFHRTTGLAALAGLDRLDAVLIDGDHNWYTVYHELKQVEACCAAAARPFPLVMLHDVGWPYGRRDQYYHPERIPAGTRQPHAKKGMRPGSVGISEHGRFNYAYWTALGEGGPRNGVLTAVEDFLRESAHPIRLVTIPGFHGLGVLVPAHLEQGDGGLADLLGSFEMTPSVLRHVEGLEAARIDLLARLQEAQPPPSRISVWKGRIKHLMG